MHKVGGPRTTTRDQKPRLMAVRGKGARSLDSLLERE